jgi:hypothetical protein
VNWVRAIRSRLSGCPAHSFTAAGFSYNQQNRLVQVANQTTALAAFQQNFLGERVVKTTSAGAFDFHYDEAGHLIAESDGTSGAVRNEYIWLDDMPVAMVSAGTLYFIHPDHLGTPQRITDANQNIVWDAALRPLGEVEQMTQTFTLNLRFPGQYADAETALNYNFFRDYDPSVGEVRRERSGWACEWRKYLRLCLRKSEQLGRSLRFGGRRPTAAPPDYDPNTWPSGQWNGRYWVQDPNTGSVWWAHPEAKGHWRHWDIENKYRDKLGSCPANRVKPWPNQKRPPYDDQSGSDPNGTEPPWTPPNPSPTPSPPPFAQQVPIQILPLDPVTPTSPVIEGPVVPAPI